MRLHTLLRFVFPKNLQSGLLTLGLLILTAGVLLTGAASETTGIVAAGDLSKYWRTTYDILVRPAGARSSIEQAHGLIEANHLSGIPGGITFAQYEAIRTISDVEIAAPIAMLGYVTEIYQIDLGRLSNPGAYVVSQTVTIDDGAHVYDQPRSTYYYVGSAISGASLESTKQTNIIAAPSASAMSWLEIPLLLTGIEPTEEAALAGVDRALLKGEYLTGNEPLNPRSSPSFLRTSQPRIDVPALINSTPYISMTVRAELKRLDLPLRVSSLEAVVAHGGSTFLASLPGEQLAFQQIRSDVAYQQLAERLHTNALTIIHQFATSTPGRIEYQEVKPPFSYEGLVLEIIMPGRPAPLGIGPAYRATADRTLEEAKFGASFALNVVGTLNIDRIPKPADINRVPLETYFPPLATLRYDEEGRPIEPRTLHPTLNPAGYISSPPLILTTLAAARALRGDNCISAIRVRVAGIDQLTPATQRKIEAIASEIVQRTGLTVDVTVGSSPRRVLVRVPGVGYVEEGWIQKGANTSYQQTIQTGNLFLLATLLIIGGLYTLDLAWADLLTRRRTIALQKALGWRSGAIFHQLLQQALRVGIVASVLGTLLAWALARTLHWSLPSLTLWIGVPLLTLALCLVGSLYPAGLAMRLPPISTIQTGNVRYARATPFTLDAVWRYAWCGLARRQRGTLLSGMAAALSSALLVFLLAVSLEREGLLVGTLLGEYVLVHIEGFHYALVGIGFGLAGLLIASNRLISVLERQREIGTLKAIGWRTTTVGRLFVVEGTLVGLGGGAAGTLLGLGVFLSLYQSGLLDVARVAGLGMLVPPLLGALAALYPAHLAARVPPAEAVRHE